MALFKENMQNMGKFNKRGHKAGIRCRIDPRVMHLGITYANQMGQSAYEAFRKTNLAFPSYSSIRKDLGKVLLLLSIQLIILIIKLILRLKHVLVFSIKI
jgi:hypothetical protein